MLLPTYDVFDESRYFEPADEIRLWSFGGKHIALAICEDLWASDPSFGRHLYRTTPAKRYCELKADLVISLSASPYEHGESAPGANRCMRKPRKPRGPRFCWSNQVCATDEILFDGGSFLLDRSGKLVGRLPLFKTGFGLVDPDASAWLEPGPKEREDASPEEIEVLHRGLVTGIGDYFARTGFSQAVLGVSGGIDSAAGRRLGRTGAWARRTC